MGFNLFGIFIPYYGFCILIGFVCAFLVGSILCKNFSLDINDFIIIYAYLLAFGFIGAKLLYIAVSFRSINFKLLFSSLENFKFFLNSGFVFFGGVITGFSGLLFIEKVHKINIKQFYKIIIPCLGIAHTFGRIGCLLAGCCYGTMTNNHFHIIYRNSIIAPNNVRLIPVQGIEALCIFLLTVVCITIIFKQKNFKIEFLYLSCYSIIRFILEFFRGDSERGKIFLLSTSQIISLIIVLLINIKIGLSYINKTRAMTNN